LLLSILRKGVNMRNPDRLDIFYEQMKKIHKERFPDWRFAQLMNNFFGWAGDCFYLEETALIKKLDEYVDYLFK